MWRMGSAEVRIVDRQYRAARLAEDDPRRRCPSRAQDDLGARHGQGGVGAGGHGGGHRSGHFSRLTPPAVNRRAGARSLDLRYCSASNAAGPRNARLPARNCEKCSIPRYGMVRMHRNGAANEWCGTRSPDAWCMTGISTRGGRHPPSPSATRQHRASPARHGAHRGKAGSSPAPPGRAPPPSPSALHGLQRAAIAARSASRGGSSRMAAKRQGAGPLRRQPARRRAPCPSRASPSQARALRWLSEGRSRAAAAGPPPPAWHQRSRTVLRQKAPRSRPRRRGDGRDSTAQGQGGDIHPVPPHRTGRRPRRAPPQSRPRRARSHHATRPLPAAARTP